MFYNCGLKLPIINHSILYFDQNGQFAKQFKLPLKNMATKPCSVQPNNCMLSF